MQEPLDVLKHYFTFDSFRGLQEPIIRSVLQANDTFGLMPTGGGKSVCFQVPGLIKPGICLVISPLIALIKDQLQGLQNKDIKAMAIIGNLSVAELSELLDNALYGNYKFLYLAPERLQQEWVLQRIAALPINLIAIDEAHCVSQWGHDFRPAYLNIKTLRQYLPDTPFLALTASATPEVKQDVIEQLELRQVQVFQSSFKRDNLAYKVMPTQDKLYATEQILKKKPEPSIVYVRNRKATISIAQNLNALNIKATSFHGGMSLAEKDKYMNLWMQEQVQVIVATNAFGMGIDKANVRNIIHWQFPENLESYYQEAGRAGRNGEYAQAVLLFNNHDVQVVKDQFLEVLPDKEFLYQVYNKLCNFFQVAYGELPQESFAFSFNQFCSKYNLPMLKTYNAITFLDRQGVVMLSQEFSKRVSLQFITSSKEVTRYMSLNPNDYEVISTILRTYSGVFDIAVPINTALIAKKATTTQQHVLQLLDKLAQLEIVAYKAQNTDASIVFNQVREDRHTINRIAHYLKAQNQLKAQKLQAVIRYATDAKTCKSMFLLGYFGEQNPKPCGICSVCVAKEPLAYTPSQIAQKVVALLAQEPYSSRELQQRLDLPVADLLKSIEILLEQESIGINYRNQYFLK